MADCFWTGFINSFASECGGTGGGEECEVSWALYPETPLPAGYSLDPETLGCRNFADTPSTVTVIRECDVQTFIVPVGSADIVCC